MKSLNFAYVSVYHLDAMASACYLLDEAVVVPIHSRSLRLAPLACHVADVRRERTCFSPTLSTLRSHPYPKVDDRRLNSSLHKKHTFPALESRSRALARFPGPSQDPRRRSDKAGGRGESSESSALSRGALTAYVSSCVCVCTKTKCVPKPNEPFILGLCQRNQAPEGHTDL